MNLGVCARPLVNGSAWRRFLLAPRARVGRRFAPPRRLRASAQNLKSHSQYMNQKIYESEIYVVGVHNTKLVIAQ